MRARCWDATARRGGWRRASHGLYLPAGVESDSPEQRIVEAAAILRDYGGVTGWAALRWMGGLWFDGLERHTRRPRPVTLAVGCKNLRPQPLIDISKEALHPPTAVEVDGVRITTTPRSVAFEARIAESLTEAVVAIDMAAFSDLCSLTELASYVATLQTWTGVPQARSALLLADENSWSPQESRLRMTWMAAGLPRPLTNRPVFDTDGRLIGVPDLLDPEAGLVVEYDGELHLAGEQRRRDARRHDAYRDVGLRVLNVMAGDMRRPPALVRRLLMARAASPGSSSSRLWTTAQPGWWSPDHTVALRRSRRRAEAG